jgi:glutathione S-transferase
MYSWHLSPFAGKARVACAFKGVDVDLIEIDPVNRPAELRKLNPSNRVPVLVLDETAIRESTPICEWAEEVGSGPSLWPADPGERAAARGLLRWVDDELSVNFFLAIRKEAFGLDKSDHEDIVAILRERLVRRWGTLDELLGRTDGPWLMGGSEPTLADLGAMPLAVRMPTWKPEVQPDPETAPRSVAWLEALRERPEVEEVDRKGS